MKVKKLLYFILFIFIIRLILKIIRRTKNIGIAYNKNELKKLNKLKIFRENLEIFDRVMKKNKIFYWVGEGTALGFIRDGDFIKNDSDVDVGIYYKDKLKFCKSMYELFREGFDIMRHLPNTIIRKGFYIDIDFTEKNIPAMAYNWPKISNNFIDYIEPFRKVKIHGIEYNVPSQKYIEYLYGTDWDKPLDNKPIDYNTYDEEIDMNIFKIKNMHYILIQELLWLFA